MDHHLCVLLWSKYSPLSKQLMGALESSPINLTSTIGLNPVCIDNEDVRERIIKAKQIDISSVPCVLIVYPSGGVEKDEGSGAFEWIEETVRKHMPPQPAPQPQPQPQPQQPPAKERKKNNRRHQIEESESSDEEYIERKPRKNSSKNKAKNKSSDEMSSTAIEDLDDEEILKTELPQRPPVAVRSGANNYDITSEFGEETEPNRDMTHRTKSTTQTTTGNSNLMATAMAMQKEREAGDPKNPRQIGDVTGERPV
jgi:hypothetical protein